jgi:probable rRNA maturation factor
MIGDVIIAPAYVKRQAGELEVDFEDEMALMVTHGILHLMGYDHQADGDASAMESREIELLGLVGKKRR